MHARVYVTKWAQGARKQNFGVAVALGGGSPKCQNGACDIAIDLENEAKVQKQNVWCSENVSPPSLKGVNNKTESDPEIVFDA